MSRLLTQAVRNNSEWCDLVARMNGVPTLWTDGVWEAASAMPPAYPRAITLRPGVRSLPDLPPHSGVKDSYADLEEERLELLFEAEWIGLAGPVEGPALGWREVPPREFGAWRLAHGEAEALPPALLEHPDVRVLTLDRPFDGRGGDWSGAILNLAAAAVGISNVFLGDVDEAAAWRGLAHAARAHFGDRPLVGYESGDALRPALLAGFPALGPLRVWLTPR
ncbi:hypothetical protein [Naasia sp. SYSU D00057]|uniref:hypothetical protein n=1 Tax=Naasia sp. SYSU D00057 TaxID=2817380 RepID=UPI001B309C70|nr:hypothetical protein [Naasia sp. SYSU D00057]